VLPGPFLPVIDAARDGRDESIEWVGATARHRIRLCKPVPNDATGS
jgi:hypothetical protein